MKKGQILAALALAFALGVVAPVAGVGAIADPTTVAECKNADNAKEYTAAQLAYCDMITAVDAAKNIEGYKYADYKALVEAIASVENAMSNTAASSIKSDLVEAMATAGLFKDAEGTALTGDDLDDAKEAALAKTAGQLITEIEASYEPGVAATALKTAVSNAESAVAGQIASLKAVVAPQFVANNAVPAALNVTATDLAKDGAVSVDTAINNAIAAAKSAAPKYAEMAKVVEAVEDATAHNTVDAVANAQRATTINNAIAAVTGTGAVTPVDPTTPEDPTTTPADPAEEDKNGAATNPGNLGALAKAEGGASATVSIMAAIATAATAAGAAFIAIRRKIAAKKEA